MDAWVWLVIVGAAVAVVVVLVVVLRSRRTTHDRRRDELRERFGPEYDRAVDQRGRRKGEAQLVDRTRRREDVRLRPLTDAAYDRYTTEWRDVQGRFVDQPDIAVSEAESLVVRVMRDRGYPVDDFDTQADIVSVDHPGLVQDYRAAHRIHERSLKRLADTDELRQALLHYRSLFDELLVRGDDTGRRHRDDGAVNAGGVSAEDTDWRDDDPEVEEALEARFGETPEERAAEQARLDAERP